MSKLKLKQTVEEICCDQCKQSWCLLKEVIISSHNDEYVRFLKQLKCLEIFKLVESEKVKQDVGWEHAWEQWALRGFAKRFSDLYTPEKDAIKLYYEVITNK
jgi:hypothetical protein